MPPVPRPPRSKGPQTAGTSSSARNQKIWLILGGAAVVAAVLIGVSYLTSNKDNAENKATSEVVAMLKGIPQSGFVLGAADAPITMIEYVDLQCPFCKQYSDDVLPTLITDYIRPGKLKIELRPLSFLGEDSVEAAQFVAAGAAQNKAWQVAEALYGQQGQENIGWVTDELLDSIGSSIPGLDADAWKTAAAGADAKAALTDASAKAQKDGVDSTPSFLISVGSTAPEEFAPAELAPDPFKARLDEALAEQ